MFGSPYGYAPYGNNYGYGYNPFLHSSYLPEYDPLSAQRAAALRRQREAEALRARALAEQRARRSQWLPDEDDDYEDDDDYRQLSPQGRMYLDAMRRQQQMAKERREREEGEAARLRSEQEEKWQKQLEQKQEEEDKRRKRILEEQRKLQQEKRAKVSSLLPTHSTPSLTEFQIPIRERSKSPLPAKPPSPRRRTPTPPPQYTEEHEQAATRIQHAYRVHHSLVAIGKHEKRFKELKEAFTYPTSIDFQPPGSDEGHISVKVVRPPPETVSDVLEGSNPTSSESSGKLAYTSQNYHLHAYVESLSKLLMQLDGVGSFGSADVRNRRREVVKNVEAELARVDQYWRNAWADYLEKKRQEEAAEAEAGKEEFMDCL